MRHVLVASAGGLVPNFETPTKTLFWREPFWEGKRKPKGLQSVSGSPMVIISEFS